jgi:hypothetical protein
MEKYIAAFLFAVTMSVNANTIKGTVTIVCANEKEFLETIISFDEEPMLTARSNRDMGNGLLTPTALVVFLNPKTGTFTIAEKVDEMYCVVAMGENMQPFFAKESQHLKKGT